MMIRRPVFRFALLAGLFVAGPALGQGATTLTVDASGEGAFVALDPEPRIVQVADAMASTEWDLGFLGTGIIVNGGETGAGDATAYCVCQNAASPDEELQRMSPDGEAADFEAVTAAGIPADASAWHPAAFAASPWYRYNIAGQHLIWPTYDVYLVRRNDQVHKVQVIGYYGPDGTPRQVTFRAQRVD